MKTIQSILNPAVVFLLLATGLVAQNEQRSSRPGNWSGNRDVVVKRDIPYLGDNDPLHTLDIYYPAVSDSSTPIMVHLHGGGWKTGDKKLMRKTGMFYASQGYIFVAPNYRLTPEVMHPVHVEDCAAAVAWTFHEFGISNNKTRRIYLSGHSAGAHLSALLGTNPDYLQKYGIYPNDLTGVIPVDSASFDLLARKNERYVKKLIKNAFGTNEQLLEEASPYHNVNSRLSYPKFLILNTTNRRLAVRGAEEFANKLKSVGARATFVPVDDHSHKDMATGMFDESDPVGRAILEFISE